MQSDLTPALLHSHPTQPCDVPLSHCTQQSPASATNSKSSFQSFLFMYFLNSSRSISLLRATKRQPEPFLRKPLHFPKNDTKEYGKYLPFPAKQSLRNFVCHKHCEQTAQEGQRSGKYQTRKKILGGRSAFLTLSQYPSHPPVDRSVHAIPAVTQNTDL